MSIKTKKHEDIIKFIHLLDKWRKHAPTEEQILTLTTVGTRRFPNEVKKSNKIARNLEIPSNFEFLDKIDDISELRSHRKDPVDSILLKCGDIFLRNITSNQNYFIFKLHVF